MTPDEENARREDVLRKVEEIKVNMERKRVAREKYDAHMRENPQAAGTDYEKWDCLLYTSPSPRDRQKSRMPSSA